MSETFDRQARVSVLEWLNRVVLEHGDVLPWKLLQAGVEVYGHQVTLIGQRGIWKPAGFRYPLSITTSPNNPYGDSFPSDRQLAYHYFKEDPQHPDNVGLREAMRDRIPLVYLHGIAKGRYVVVWPVFIRGESSREKLFFVEADDLELTLPSLAIYREGWRPAPDAANGTDARRVYVTREVRQRLHQRVFRERVLAAYSKRCAICRLRHERLLDAAHIIADSHEEGVPIVSNGLSLCKLHHAAFDADVIGIRPDYTVVVQAAVLRERDGPMLLHGIQGIHGKPILVPRAREKRPDLERLSERFRQFLEAS